MKSVDIGIKSMSVVAALSLMLRRLRRNKMIQEDFDILVNKRLAECKKTLTAKTGIYASKKDRLHNFKIGAALVRQTPEQYAMALATKHIVAIADKLVNKEVMSPDFVIEKMGDVINYMLLIEALNQEKLK